MNRMSYPRFLEILRHDGPFYEELGRSHAIRPRWEANDLLVDIDWHCVSPATEQWMREQIRGIHDAIDLWLRAELVTHGPKVFRPTLDQTLAMEQITPQICTGDYHQPYSVMIVEFPDEYRRRRTCMESPGGNAESPECVIVGFHESPVSTLWADTVFNSARMVRVAILPSDTSIETGIVRECGEDSYAEADAFDVSHRLVLAGALRVAINAMLLLAAYGCKRIGPSNPGHYSRLQRHAAASQHRGQGVEDARRNLRLAPQMFGLPQEILLYDREPRRDLELHSESVSPRRPHWRRGHWKMHAHGPNRSLRKRIFVRPVLVNHQLLAGREQTAEVVYRAR
jgi:hypothetical protein